MKNDEKGDGELIRLSFFFRVSYVRHLEECARLITLHSHTFAKLVLNLHWCVMTAHSHCPEAHGP